MSDRFIKFIPSDTASWLRSKHPFAFLLLSLIAERARREEDHIDGLKPGEAFIGDHNLIGATRGQYRHALKILETNKFLQILETCRTRKKATTGTTTVGTKVKLLDSRVWDVNLNIDNHRNNHPTTTEQPPNNHPTTTKKKEEEGKRKKKKEEENKKLAPNDSHESSTPSIKIYFSFETSTWQNIAPDDIDLWQGTYPGVDIKLCLNRMADWLLSNTSRAPKSNFRAFITRWLTREQNNTANKTASKFQYGSIVDRRTRDKEGNPIESPCPGRF